MTQRYDSHSADACFSRFDDLVEDGRFAEADAYLYSLNPNRLDEAEIVAICAATWCARDQLPGRAAFVHRCRRRVVELAGSRAEFLLRGLE